jgi:hypothetical protein
MLHSGGPGQDRRPGPPTSQEGDEMKTFSALKYSGAHRPTLAQTSSWKRLCDWVNENGGHYITAAELRRLRKVWRDSGGQPSVVLDLDAKEPK